MLSLCCNLCRSLFIIIVRYWKIQTYLRSPDIILPSSSELLLALYRTTVPSASSLIDVYYKVCVLATHLPHEDSIFLIVQCDLRVHVISFEHKKHSFPNICGRFMIQMAYICPTRLIFMSSSDCMHIGGELLPWGTRQIAAQLFSPRRQTCVGYLSSLKAAVKPRSSSSNQLHGTRLPHCMVRNELLKELSRCLQFYYVEPPLNRNTIEFNPLSLSRIEVPEAITMTVPEILHSAYIS
jgi:hypothetical protein